METITIPATDGQPLRGRLFEPERRADLTFRIAPGIGVPQRLFTRTIGPAPSD